MFTLEGKLIILYLYGSHRNISSRLDGVFVGFQDGLIVLKDSRGLNHIVPIERVFKAIEKPSEEGDGGHL
jgi:hypothetical protein